MLFTDVALYLSDDKKILIDTLECFPNANKFQILNDLGDHNFQGLNTLKIVLNSHK